MKHTLLVLICFSLLAVDGRCCGVCLDQQLAMGAPWVIPAFLVYLGWMAASVLFYQSPLASACREIEIFPRDKDAVRLLWITPLVVLILWIVSTGSLKLPMLLIMAVWLPSVLIRSVLFIRKWAAERPVKHGRLRAGFLGFQLFTAAALAAAVGGSVHLSHTPASLASRLGYPFDGRQSIVRELIAHGENAVDPLIAVTRQALNDPANYNSPAGPALHCLGMIGGAGAASFLESVVKDRVKFDKDDPFDNAWQRAACFAYARAAGAGAAPGLIELYKKCGQAPALRERWTILTALVMTGGHDALAFVLDHMNDLLDKADRRDDRDNALAGAAVAALLAMKPPQSFGDLPTLRACQIRGMADRPAAEDYRDAILLGLGKSGSSFGSLWREREPQVRKWLAAEP